VISLLAGAVTYVTLSVLGVPFAVPLAVLMAFLDLVPLVGGGAHRHRHPVHRLPDGHHRVDRGLGIYQQVENNVVQPVVYRRTVNVQPLVVIISILVGAALLGVLGALVAIPIAGALQIAVREAWARRHPGGTVLLDGAGEVEGSSEPSDLVTPPPR